MRATAAMIASAAPVTNSTVSASLSGSAYHSALWIVMHPTVNIAASSTGTVSDGIGGSAHSGIPGSEALL